MRERPVLAADVFEIGDLHPDLFAHLADHALLHRLAGLDEAGQGTDPGTKRGERASNTSSPRVTRTIMLGDRRGYWCSPHCGHCITRSWSCACMRVPQLPQNRL